MTITVSTDGSALGNPNGPMGWAWADHDTKGSDGHHHAGDCDAGGATNGTNQIGELCAVLEALRTHPGTEPLTIETDSQYAINCSTKWVHGWKKNGWRNSKKEPVRNAPLIKAIDHEIRSRKGPVKFVWVKGHNGNPGNEKVDELARTYAEDCRAGVVDGYLPPEGWQSVMDSPYARGLDVPQDAHMLLDGALTAADDRLQRGKGGSGPMRDAAGAAQTHAHTDASAHEEPSEATRDAADTAPSTAAPSATASAASRQDDDARASTATQPTTPTQPTVAPQPASGPQLVHSGLHVSGEVRVTPPPESSPYYDGTPKRVRGYIEVDVLVAGDGTARLDGAPFLVVRQ